ncbi:MAG TPA: hypothetical protein VIJ57_13095 [Hanamia sp.]
MKKIFTIIFVAAGTIGAASAQSINQKNIAYNEHSKMSNERGLTSNHATATMVNYNDANFSKAKAAKLDMINHEYDQKMASVKNNRHLSTRQKTKQIQMLQNRRKNEINKVEMQYAKSSHIATSKTPGHQSHK